MDSLRAESSPLRGQDLGRFLHADQRWRWESGAPLSLEQYLKEIPGLLEDEEAFVELILGEMELRRLKNETPRLEEYLTRFPRHTSTLRRLSSMAATMKPVEAAKTPRPGNRPTQKDEQGVPEPPPEAPYEMPPTPRAPVSLGSMADMAHAASAVAKAAPPRFGPFEILGELGRGGMGVVYKARDTRLDRVVALKVMLSGERATQEEMQRFVIESESAAQLKHPNIVPIYEVGRHENQPFFAMEFAEGGSLYYHLEGAPIPATEAARYAALLARGIQHAHEHGVIHRDLKPGNILLSPAGTGVEVPNGPLAFLKRFTPKICDFSLAKRLEKDEQLTATGAVLGTPCYMAPEQACGATKEIGPASDLYSLGAILYEMLTGRPPFTGTSIYETMEQVRMQDPVPPSRLRARLPRDLEVICLKCLEKDSAKRYESAAALADDLERFLADRPILARPVGPVVKAVRWAKRRPAIAGLTLALLMVAALGFAGVSWKWYEANEAREAEATQRGVAERAKMDAEKKATDEATARNRAELAEQEAARKAESEAKARTEAELARAEANRRAESETLARGMAETERGKALEAQAATEQQLYYQRIALAEREWRSGNVARTLELLDACPASLRGWEWHHLRKLCHLASHVLKGHQGGVNDVAYRPDGRQLASAGDDGSIRLWDSATGKEQRSLAGHAGPAWAVAYSPDSTRLASAGEDRVIRVWDIATGKEVVHFTGHEGAVVDLAFSVRGFILVSASVDGTARVWDARAGGEQVALLVEAKKTRALGVAFSPDNKLIAVALGDPLQAGVGEVRLLEGRTGKELFRLEGHTDAVAAVAFSPDSRQLASAGYDQSVRLWDTATGRETTVLRGHSQPVLALAYSADGRALASASLDQLIHVWNMPSLENPNRQNRVGPIEGLASRDAQTLRGHLGHVLGLAFHPKSAQELATVGRDGTVRLWDRSRSSDALALLAPEGSSAPERPRVRLRGFSPEGGEELRAGGLGEVRAMTLVGGNVEAITTGQGGLVRVQADLTQGKTQNTSIPLPRGSARPLAVAQQGNKGLVAILGLSAENKMQIALLGREGEPPTWSEGIAPDARVLALSPAGDAVAAPGINQTVKVWDTATPKEVLSLPDHADAVGVLAFDPTGKFLATGDVRGRIRIFERAGGKCRLNLQSVDSEVTALEFNAAGTRIASASRDRKVRVHDTATGAEVAILSGHADAILTLAFSPEGRRLATAGVDRTIRLWDLTTAQEVLTLRGHREPIGCLAFTMDGRWLLSGGRDGRILAREAGE